MKKIIYVEKEIIANRITKQIIRKFKNPFVIEIDSYTEVFNKKNQNFRTQKVNPAVILAKKKGNFIYKTPSKYTIGNELNYYFSYMYNCVFDCQYCFLQGLYASSNYLVFVNYNDFFHEVRITLSRHINKKVTFFSGYDCDSLAYESNTNFMKQAIKSFEGINNAELEIRTKSTYSQVFSQTPLKNVVVAYSFTPQRFSSKYEIGVPSVEKRISTLKKLAKKGWKIGIRFDPIIIYKDWQRDYELLFKNVLGSVPEKNLHSVTYGNMRFPKDIYKKILQTTKNKELLNQLSLNESLYEQSDKKLIRNLCDKLLYKYVDRSKVFCNF